MRLIEFFRRIFGRKKARQNREQPQETPQSVHPVYDPSPIVKENFVEPVTEVQVTTNPSSDERSAVAPENTDLEKEPVEVPLRQPSPQAVSEKKGKSDVESVETERKIVTCAAQPEVTVTTKQTTVYEPVSQTPSAAPAEQITEEVKGDTRIIRKIVVVSANRLVNVRYDKSFTAKLKQASDENKAYYSELKNELLSYKKVHSRISWRQDTFRKGRNCYAKLAMRGKTLCLYLALDPQKYENSKYILNDVSDVKKNEDTPCLYRIKNNRRLRYAKELIAEMFADTQRIEAEPFDYAADFTYEENEPLLERGLIKLIKERKNIFEEETSIKNGELEIEVPREVTVAAAEELLKDEIAEVLVRESGNASVRGKQTIVNVDTLGEYFEEGESVTLEAMRDRIPFLNKKATYVKVLARGALAKSLEVEADDFSLAAVKMIVLAGGNVYRKRSD